MPTKLPLFQFQGTQTIFPLIFLQKLIILIALQTALFSSVPLPAILCCLCIILYTHIRIPSGIIHTTRVFLLFAPVVLLSAGLRLLYALPYEKTFVFYLISLVITILMSSCLFLTTTQYDYVGGMRTLARVPLFRTLSFVLSFVFIFVLHISETRAILHEALFLRGIRLRKHPIRYAKHMSLGLIIHQIRYIEIVHDTLLLRDFSIEKWKTLSQKRHAVSWTVSILFSLIVITYPIAWELILS